MQPSVKPKAVEMSVVNSETVDRLTPWLLANLHSDDLDAKDMSDYVVSLISAPGSQDQLYARCKAELEEFLGSHTEPFVNALFEQIAALQQGNSGVLAPPAEDKPMSGGQEEFRRNFRSDAKPFTPQNQQNSRPRQGQFPNMPPGFPQGFPPGFPQELNQGFPGMPPNFSMPPGMPPNMFPPFNSSMPPQFGFQGFGKSGKFNKPGQFPGPRQPRRPHSTISTIQNEHSVANRGLVIEKVPPEHLNKESVEQYFGRFGKLVEIKVNEQQELVEIQFEGHDQAVEAHKCPEPIFGNRFVKVFWRKHENEPELDVEAVRRMQALKQQQFLEKEARRKELTTEMRSVMGEQAGILQQRQQMLQSGKSDPQTQADMQLKSSQLSLKLKELKQELAVLQGGASSGPSRGGFRGRGSNPYSRGGRAPRGNFRGNYGGSFGGPNKFSGASLDRRPRGVLVEGVYPDKDEALRTELASRNYTGYTRKSDHSVAVEFADRRSAEDFFNNDLADFGELKKTWFREENSQASLNAMDSS